MKNNDWLDLPVFLDSFFTKDIMDKAKMVRSHDERLMDVARRIAENEKVEPGKFISRWFPRDKFDILEWIQEDPDNPEYSDIYFADDDFWMVNMTHDKLMKKVHKFLLQEPSYRESQVGTEVTFIPHSSISQEERDEMEGDED